MMVDFPKIDQGMSCEITSGQQRTKTGLPKDKGDR